MSQKRIVIPASVSSRRGDIARSPSFASGRDVFRLGQAVMAIESQAKQGNLDLAVTIPVSLLNLERFQVADLASEIERLCEFFWPIEVTVHFAASDTRVRTTEIAFAHDGVDAVCLFSGGVDSLAAVLSSLGSMHPVALFVAHSDQAGAISIVSGLSESVLRRRSIPLMRMYAPPMRRTGYSQARGFLYGMAALALADTARIGQIVIGECGPTMFQPRFGPFDYTTMTSHPVVLETIRGIAHHLNDGHVKLTTPLADSTKAEAIARLPSKNLLRLTHSCISQQFRRHDGTCYGCVIRRLASLDAGFPDVDYKFNPLAGRGKGKDNVLSLLRFSHDVLEDFDALPPETIEEMQVWKTRGLFERFALDNLAGFYLWTSVRGPRTPLAERVSKVFGLRGMRDQLIDRIHHVRRLHRAFAGG